MCIRYRLASSTPEGEAFIADMLQVCLRHGLTITLGDHGGLLVEVATKANLIQIQESQVEVVINPTYLLRETINGYKRTVSFGSRLHVTQVLDRIGLTHLKKGDHVSSNVQEGWSRIVTPEEVIEYEIKEVSDST